MRITLPLTLVFSIAFCAVMGQGLSAEDKPAATQAGKADATPADKARVPGHATFKLEGWTIHVSEELRTGEPEATDEALRLLEGQLKEVVRVIPPAPLAQLRQVPIWFTSPPPGFGPTGEYHPDAGWLKDHNRDTAMAKAIQFILIHEFAHNIHLRGMIRVDPKFDVRVKEAYDEAMRKKLWAGKYASVNHHEYFAEGVQSWFNNNRCFDQGQFPT